MACLYHTFGDLEGKLDCCGVKYINASAKMSAQGQERLSRAAIKPSDTPTVIATNGMNSSQYG
jgi:hypothetical protein